MATTDSDKVRLDKWLWVARFFKTRNLAKQAIEGGKVHYNGVRSKTSKEVEIGAELSIRQGYDEKSVIVLALSGQRQGATQAQALYRETEASINNRERNALLRKLMNPTLMAPSQKPDKKKRRQIHQFIQRHGG